MKNETTHFFDGDKGTLLYQRIGQIFTGIGKPRDSLEYKIALIEIQRLSAPFTALFIPMLAILVAAIFVGMEKEIPAPPVRIEEMRTEELPKLEDPQPEEMPQIENSDEVVVKFDHPTPSPVASPTKTETTQNIVREVPSALIMSGIMGGKEGMLVGGGGLGGNVRQEGDMLGTLYDFKRDHKGAARKVDYWNDLKTIIDGKLTDKAFSGFYKVNQPVYLSHLWVPKAPAEIGPEAFGVKGLMEPKGWIAHYTGTVQPEESGQYRFVGHFDDAMVVMIDGKVVLEAEWDFVGKTGIMGWAPKEFNQQHTSPTGQCFVYGDWIEFSSSAPKRIDLLVGERPGGSIGGILLIQKKGVDYPKASDGRPLLPPFLTSPLSFPERTRLEGAKYKGFPVFNMNIPLMNTAGRKKVDLRSENEIDVNSGDL